MVWLLPAVYCVWYGCYLQCTVIGPLPDFLCTLTTSSMRSIIDAAESGEDLEDQVM